jgi:signal transduction histidine kinase
MVEALQGLPLRCAVCVRSSDRQVRDAWPERTELSAELIEASLRILHPEVLPLATAFPADASRFPGAEALILPIDLAEARPAVCILISGGGALAEHRLPWEQLARALSHLEGRYERSSATDARCRELQARVEEIEALHTLGLSANRTLDVAEVLNLVARFTRTLLGAHYVTVNTVERGATYSVASVGLRNVQASRDGYLLARAIVEAEKPLLIGGGGGNLEVENFPFHAGEGMKSGLGIPLTLFGDTFGALVVGYRHEYEISARDIRFGLTLAGHAAVAISNARLHATVEERSRQLQSANDELNRITQAKERFFASINHELRNPVGAILGYHTLLLEGNVGELPPRATSFIRKANRAARTLQKLVDEILDLSRLAAGKMELNLAPICLDEIIAEVMNTIEPVANEKGVQVQIEVAPDIPMLMTDGARVQQVLVNLLSNAVKFADRGAVRLGAALSPASGKWLEIRVSDNGPGITPDDLKRVFKEYEQVEGTRGGTGLGLPISRRLARAIGGELVAESEVGAGSTFILRLPVNGAVESAAPAMQNGNSYQQQSGGVQ